MSADSFLKALALSTAVGDSRYTGYWISAMAIFGPKGYTGYWISEGHIFGPRGYTQCWIDDEKHIFSNTYGYIGWISGDYIYGQTERMPWIAE
jgi:hypothetical protein